MRYASTTEKWHQKTNADVRRMLFVTLGHQYPMLKCITIIDAASPPDDNCCERRVSALNRTKTKHRNRLSNNVLNDLLQISINGPNPRDMKDTDWAKLMDIWRGAKARGRYSGKIWQSEAAAMLDRQDVAS